MTLEGATQRDNFGNPIGMVDRVNQGDSVSDTSLSHLSPSTQDMKNLNTRQAGSLQSSNEALMKSGTLPRLDVTGMDEHEASSTAHLSSNKAHATEQGAAERSETGDHGTGDQLLAPDDRATDQQREHDGNGHTGGDGTGYRGVHEHSFHSKDHGHRKHRRHRKKRYGQHHSTSDQSDSEEETPDSEWQSDTEASKSGSAADQIPAQTATQGAIDGTTPVAPPTADSTVPPLGATTDNAYPIATSTTDNLTPTAGAPAGNESSTTLAPTDQAAPVVPASANSTSVATISTGDQAAPAATQPTEVATPTTTPAAAQPTEVATPATAPAAAQPTEVATPATAPAAAQPPEVTTPTTAPAAAQPTEVATPATAPAAAQPPEVITPTTAPAAAQPTNPLTPTTTTTTAGTGAFVAGNGEIVGPTGQVFTAKGVNLPTPVDSVEISTLFQDYPDTNMIRLNASDTGTVFGTSGGTVANIESTVSAIEAAKPGTVVEIEDHTYGADNNPNTLSGSALAPETSWYSQLASYYKNNPDVWFGTPNEPMGSTANIVAEQSAVYNAIRSTGNNNPIMLENMGGGVPSNITGDPSAFSGMTNVVYDAHFYQDAYGANDSANNPSTPAADLQGIVSADQSVKTGDPGVTPVIVGEHGPSTDGTSLDSNGYGFVDAAQSSALSGETSGALAWVAGYNPNPQGQELIDPSTGQETTWGAEVGNFINNSVVSNPN